MRTGRIIFLDHERNSGIIEDENEQEISFVPDAAHEELMPGSLVLFEIAIGTDGLYATSIRLVL